MKHLLPLPFALLATAASADTNYSELIATDGLAAARSELMILQSPSASDQFALGGIHFLSAIEAALQTRYIYDLNGLALEATDLPILRLPIFDNPNPEPFRADVVETVFEAALDDFAAALVALDTISDEDDVAVRIDTMDIWFDVNMNARRDVGEGLFEITGSDMNRALADGFVPPVIDFDTADAAWLSAYAHLLSGVSEGVLAVDPTTAIESVIAGAQMFDSLRQEPIDQRSYWLSDDELPILDGIVSSYTALQGPVNAARSRAMHQHLLSMIDDNKIFWDRVAKETDNSAEWIPNKKQSSALPIPFPEGLGEQWRLVLRDAERLLNGELLLPHWRSGSQHGINLASLLQDPPEIDLIGYLHGWKLADHIEAGALIDGQSLQRFQRLVGGDAAFYAVILN